MAATGDPTCPHNVYLTFPCVKCDEIRKEHYARYKDFCDRCPSTDARVCMISRQRPGTDMDVDCFCACHADSSR